MKYQATILIPTYERPQYLARSSSFIQRKFDLSYVRFVVLDGSLNNFRENADICARYGLEYYHYGKTVSIEQRLFEGLKLVTTPAVSFLADDDILSPSGFSHCVDFLMENLEYSVAHGVYANFCQQNNQFETMPGYAIRSIEDVNPCDRLYEFLANYQPIWYAVYRTEILKTAIKEAVENIEENDYHCFELLAGCIPVVLGKVKKLDVSYYGRQLIQSVPRPTVEYPMLLLQPNFISNHNTMKQSILKFIHNVQNTDKVTKAVDLSFLAYYGNFYVRSGLVLESYRLLNLTQNNNQQHQLKKAELKVQIPVRRYLSYPFKFFKRETDEKRMSREFLDLLKQY